MWLRFVFIALLATITASADVKVVDQKSFDSEIQSGKVLVDFYGPWCGPCKQMNPVIEQIAAEMGDQVKIIKVNIDDSADLASKNNVQAVPTLVLFVNGKEKSRLVGFQSKTSLKNMISSN